MSKYLARLKVLTAGPNPETHPVEQLPKLTDGGQRGLLAVMSVPGVGDFPETAPESQGCSLNPKVVLASDFEERAAILEYDAGLPRTWAEHFARQLVKGPPGDFSPTRWQAAIDGALMFADQWATEAHRLGWRVEDAFGMHPTAPAARYDCRGLAWLLGDGSRVLAIDSKGAEMAGRSGSKQRFYRRRA